MHTDSAKILICLPVILKMLLDYCSAHTPLGGSHIAWSRVLSISMLVYWYYSFHFCIILVYMGSGYDDPGRDQCKKIFLK